MKLTNFFTKTLRSVSQDEAAKNAKHLIRAGYIHKEMAGVYSFLPLGLRTLRRIEQIVREEMNAIGGMELQLTALQDPKPWQATDRWDDQNLDVWFKTALNSGGEIGLAPTHEEPITKLMTKFLLSYKDLPAYPYQFQTKFRNELRAKSGILRTREFLMKDLYSFSPDEESHLSFYQKIHEAYLKIYQRLGLGDCTYRTFASGGAFSKYSHEYQTVLPVGEDTIYFNADKSIVLNEEVLNDEVLADLKVKREELTSAKAAEVGNIFTLGTRFSTPLGLNYHNQSGETKTVFMGSYGIGISRVMGVIVEKYVTDQGLIWPEEVAPYKFYLVPIGDEATTLSHELEARYPEQILLDDRPLRPGEKFADVDLLGLPYRLVISDKTLAEHKLEFTNRKTHETKLLTLEKLHSIFTKYEEDH